MQGCVDIRCSILVMALLEDSDRRAYCLTDARLIGAERDNWNASIMEL
jgi:hypothetical protein